MAQALLISLFNSYTRVLWSTWQS